jgi:hypothetical protein
VLVPVDKIHPALKHAGYSATSLLPGEDAAEFEELYRALIAEFTPVGPLEANIVADIARLTWRKQNLATIRIAEQAKVRDREINDEKLSPIKHATNRYLVQQEKELRQGRRAAEEQARQELGDIYQLLDIGATMDGLTKELDIKERLDGLISKKLKQLLMVRGVKSLSRASSSVSTPQILAPPGAA